MAFLWLCVYIFTITLSTVNGAQVHVHLPTSSAEHTTFYFNVTGAEHVFAE